MYTPPRPGPSGLSILPTFSILEYKAKKRNKNMYSLPKTTTCIKNLKKQNKKREEKEKKKVGLIN